MTTQVFSRLSVAAHDPSLVIGSALDTVTTGANALSNARKALGELPKATGFFYFEAFPWTTVGNAFGTNFSVGIARPDSPLNACVGLEALSLGYFPGTGEIRQNNVVIASSANWVRGEQCCIQVFGNLNSGFISFAVNGSFLANLASPFSAGTFFVPALTVAGGNAGENNWYINLGLTGFFYPITSAPA